MSAIAEETQTGNDFAELKSRLKAIWTSGDYDVFSRFMEKDAQAFFSRLGVKPGTRLLDVGCGSGQLALIAARAGAQVSGCDIAPNWIEKARARAAAEGLDIAFTEGDAEALPYADGEFDVVVSLIGAMFAPGPDLVAAELTRVCRPGGTIAMANWTPGGFIGQMFKAISKHIAPSGMPAPVLWGDENVVRERLSKGIADLKFTLQHYHFDYPFPPDAVVEFYRRNYGPMARAFASLDSQGQDQLRRDLVELWSEYNMAKDGSTKVDAEYLEVIATKSGNASVRAGKLADRILQGATELARFAEGLSEEEWRKPISDHDLRTAGIVVHHVASMYPVEIDLTRAVASGKAMMEITPEAVNDINAKHANKNEGVTKAEALELLRKNSQEAAAAVRAFTDDELDQAAPIGLSFGAPVTAQFVIEDHPLRHSWHHLARIRTALGR